jgi:hypothetical protein
MKRTIIIILFWTGHSMFILGQNTTGTPKFVYYRDTSSKELTPREKYILKNPDKPDIFNMFIGTRISFRNYVDIAGEKCMNGETYASFKLLKGERIVSILFAENTPTSIQAMFYFAIKDSAKYWQIPDGLNEYSLLLPIKYDFDCCPSHDPRITRISSKRVQEFAKGKIVFTDKSEVDIKDFGKVLQTHEWSCIE